MGAVGSIITGKAKDGQVEAFADLGARVSASVSASDAAKGMLEAFGTVHYSQTQGH